MRIPALALLLAVAGLSAAPDHGHAQTIIYSGTLRGELILTGNTLGLDGGNGGTAPGTHGGVGAFISNPLTWMSERLGTFAEGTTGTWQRNGSSAVLDLPATGGVDRAILLWSCSSQLGGIPATPLTEPATVTLVTPDGVSRAVSPSFSKTDITLANTNNRYYQRWADVTDVVRAGGAGAYTVAGVVGAMRAQELSACGWGLFVVHTDVALPIRNITLWNIGQTIRFTGNTATNLTTTIPVTGFCTPDTNFAAEGSMVVAALEGDARYTKDTLEILDPLELLDPGNWDEYYLLSGPNNAANNFFASQINGTDGQIDTRGTFGTANHGVIRDPDPLQDGLNTRLVAGARQGWDLTTIPLNDFDYNPAVLVSGQTETTLRIRTGGDDFILSALGLTLNFDAPSIVATAAVDREEAYVAETVTWTFMLQNEDFGRGDDVYFCADISPNLSLIPSSVTVDGVPIDGVSASLVDPVNCAGTTGGLPLGSFDAGESRVVVMQFEVTELAEAPAPLDSLQVKPSWRSEWRPLCDGAALQVDRQEAPVPPVGGVVLNYSFTVNPVTPPKLDVGDEVTFTVSVRNDGAVNSRPGVTVRAELPAGLAYVPGSTTLNNVGLNDVGGGSPFLAPAGRLVQSVGASSGVVAAGRSAVASFRARVEDGAAKTLFTRAWVDPDSATAPLAEVALTPVRTDVESEIVLDTDRDTIPDDVDNCPFIPNPQQQNTYDEGVYTASADDEGNHCDDTDGDGLLDAEEDRSHDGPAPTETDATKVDTDGDGLCDGALRVQPCVAVEDGDGDKDAGDWGNGEPSPIDPDSDDDGICDGAWAGGACRGGEFDLGSSPVNTDSDRDGLCDGPLGGGWDDSGCRGRETDPEGDHGLVIHTHPARADSDNDSLCDGFPNPHDRDEVACFASEDADGDRDPADWALGASETNPLNPDTDGGSAKDGEELQRGSDPRNPCDDVDAANCDPEVLIVEGGGCAGGVTSLGLFAALLFLGVARLRQRGAA